MLVEIYNRFVKTKFNIIQPFQVIAGYQGDDDDITESDSSGGIWKKSEDLEEDKCVKKLSAQITQVIGWSDVHLASKQSPGRVVSLYYSGGSKTELRKPNAMRMPNV